jgi:hypothetical protein
VCVGAAREPQTSHDPWVGVHDGPRGAGVLFTAPWPPLRRRGLRRGNASRGVMADGMK